MEFLNITLLQSGSFQIKLVNAIVALLILLFALLVNYVLGKIIRRNARNSKINEGQALVLTQLASYTIFPIALLLIISNFGVNITVLLFGSSALLVGLGFGLQQLFQDIISGIILLFDKSIHVQDTVQSDAFIGKIQHIGLRATSILTTDNVVVLVPNSLMISNNLVNLTHSAESTRFEVKVGVAYGSDTEKVAQILYNCAIDHEKTENKPEPQIFFTDFGDSALMFELRFWTVNVFNVETVKSELRFMIDKRFREHNIRIPYQQHDIHIIDSPKDM